MINKTASNKGKWSNGLGCVSFLCSTYWASWEDIKLIASVYCIYGIQDIVASNNNPDFKLQF